MGISVQWMLDGIARKRLAGSGPRFEEVFLLSVNQVIADLNTTCDFTIPDVTNTSDSINLDTTKYLRAFMHGIPYYMQLFAEWAKDPPEAMKFIYDRAMAICQFHAVTDADEKVGFTPFNEA